MKIENNDKCFIQKSTIILNLIECKVHWMCSDNKDTLKISIRILWYNPFPVITLFY